MILLKTLQHLVTFCPAQTKYANIKERMGKVTYLLVAIFLLLARSKIYKINFWIENYRPPPFETFPKIHPFWYPDPSLSVRVRVNSGDMKTNHPMKVQRKCITHRVALKVKFYPRQFIMQSHTS